MPYRIYGACRHPKFMYRLPTFIRSHSAIGILVGHSNLICCRLLLDRCQVVFSLRGWRASKILLVRDNLWTVWSCSSCLLRYEPTIEEVHTTTIEIEGQLCSLELLDTAGIEQFAQMRDDQIAEGHGFILVYSVTDKSTFDDVRIIREEVTKIKRWLVEFFKEHSFWHIVLHICLFYCKK